MTATASPLKAVQFLQRWPTPFPHLTAIHVDPDTGEKSLVESKAFAPGDWSAVASWIGAREGRANIYFTVNPLRAPKDSKALKDDVASLVALHVDVDAPDGEDQAAFAERAVAGLKTFPAEPSAIIKSGGGVQAFWLLPASDVVTVDGDAIKIEAAERYTRGVEEAVAQHLGLKVDRCFNIDRIMRVPFTTNVPDRKKRDKGRVPMVAELVEFTDLRWPLGTFQPAAPKDLAPVSPSGEPAKSYKVAVDWEGARDLFRSPELSLDGLRARKVEEQALLSLQHGDNLDRLAEEHRRTGHRVAEGAYGSFSQVTLAVATALLKAGLEPEECAAVMSDPAHPGNKHVTRQKGDKEKHRAVERALSRAASDLLKRDARARATAAGIPEWKGGTADEAGLYPIPNAINARVGLDALGVKARLDLFHHKVVVSYQGEDRVLEESITDFLNDRAEAALVGIMIKRWGFDPSDLQLHRALIIMATEHAFDPVLDYLDECQGKWDGVRRLDDMAATYFGCAGTVLERKFLRTMMVASVRRARQPGCKFDVICVLESREEGFGKSSAVCILYGADNFSDQTILGVRDKEAQELLTGVWGFECADLSGVVRSEVEHTKAFASRTEDRARPAYGRNMETRKRRCAIWASTNDDRYLQSQTGNRRFWPVRCGVVDLTALQRDRDQLWAEAATLEAAGESIMLPEELWATAREAQEERRVLDPWEDALASMPRAITTHDGTGTRDIRVVWNHVSAARGEVELVASATVLTHVLGVAAAQQTSAHGKRLAQAMSRLGWQRDLVTINKVVVRGYWRARVDAPIVEAAAVASTSTEVPF